MGRFLNSVSWTPSKDDPTKSTSFSEVASGHSFFLPMHYTPTYHYPLVVWLHSNGFNESQVDDVMPHISVRNYIGVGVRATKAADAVGHRFDWHQGNSAICAAHDSIVCAVDEATERFSVHPKRVILAGYRDGGTMALRIAMRQPDRFAAAVSLGGAMPQGAIRNINQLRQRRLPMLWQWGGANERFTSENLKSDCQMAMTIGGQVEVRQYPGDDEMDTVVLKDIDDFIMRRIVSQSSAVDSDRWSSSPTAYSAN
jgi:phospholipase/carboxylesterase